jgi:hypothetical protein
VSAIHLYDRRDPIDAGRAVFRSLLAGQDVAADRMGLVHALYDAAEHVSATWNDLAEAMAGVAHSNDVMGGREAVAARDAAVRATEIGFAILAAMWELPGIAVAERQFAEFDESDDA